jgi:uncharacterized protein
VVVPWPFFRLCPPAGRLSSSRQRATSSEVDSASMTFLLLCRSSRAVNLPRRSWSDCGAMSAERATYLDSSALVKLAVREPQSAPLRRYVRGRRIVSSALARTEVARALLSEEPAAIKRGQDVLAEIDLIRIDRVLTTAGTLQPATVRSLDAIHLATATLLGDELGRVVTYDTRLAAAARHAGLRVVAPGERGR